jgi:hypothetical protein
MERMEKADGIGVDAIRTHTDFEQAKERETQWNEYNRRLLSNLFTTDEFANEYASALPSLYIVADRYFDPTLDRFKDRLVRRVAKQISALVSIIGQLDLIQEEVTASGSSENETPERNLELLFERFHLVARRMQTRRASRPTLQITDEYDVQDLLHALLTIFFEDIRKEEWAPSYAGAATKMDYLLPELETAVEVKKTRPTLTARDVGEELIVDIKKYQEHPRCRKLVCFVYDPDGFISNPRGVEADLSKQHDKLAVRVMIRPR